MRSPRVNPQRRERIGETSRNLRNLNSHPDNFYRLEAFVAEYLDVGLVVEIFAYARAANEPPTLAFERPVDDFADALGVVTDLTLEQVL